jgi:predicted PurR-regulated permease PerM
VTLGRQAAFWTAALAAVLLFLWIFSGILLPFIMGIALAYLLDPIADRLQAAGMNRFWATMTIILLAILVFSVAGLTVVPLLASQLAGFLDRLPSYVTSLQTLGNRFFQTEIGRYFDTGAANGGVDQVVAQGASWVATVLETVWAGGQALISVVSLIVVTPVVAFYLL